MAKKFYLCKKCGNIVGLIKEGGGNLTCCNEPMQELVANTTDAAQEKHVPVVTFDPEDNRATVQVGSVAHPMQAEHYIEWIHLQTNHGAQIKHLKPGDEPQAVFNLSDGDEPLAALAYCNLHGLWKKEF